MRICSSCTMGRFIVRLNCRGMVHTLAGRYADGLSLKSGTRRMHVSLDVQEPPSAGEKTGQGYVVVYRVKYKPLHGGGAFWATWGNLPPAFPRETGTGIGLLATAGVPPCRVALHAEPIHPLAPAGGGMPPRQRPQSLPPLLGRWSYRLTRIFSCPSTSA